MPVSYQAFREITNFIRNNGDDWDEFCTKTAHTTKNAKKASNPSKKTIEAQDCYKQRTGSQTATPGKSTPLRAISHPP
jgi:hypothetical protein